MNTTSSCPFPQCEGLGLYVHIPFCRELCGFCPYCKVQYDRAVCDRYLDRLIQEIHLVGGQLPGRKKGHQPLLRRRYAGAGGSAG